jgi:predicted component of type VI protein secretion system
MANRYLEIEAGAPVQRFELPTSDAEIVVGRSSESGWVIASGSVSRRHARFRIAGNEVTLEDLGSSNGTFVNGERLSGPRALKDQDRLQIGSVEIRLVMPAEEASPSDATISIADLPPEMRGAASPPPAERAPPPSAAPKAAPAPSPPPATPPPAPPPAPHASTPGTNSGSATRSVPPPPPAVTIPPPAPLPEASASRPAVATASSTGSRTMASTATSTGATRPASAAPLPVMPDAAGPTMIELAVIAVGSFLVVFGVGALVIRYLF